MFGGYLLKEDYLKKSGANKNKQAGGSCALATVPTSLRGPRLRRLSLGLPTSFIPLADTVEAGEWGGVCPDLSRRTFQELAEVKVVLCDHVRDHLLVEADDLEQGGFQKNGFCII